MKDFKFYIGEKVNITFGKYNGRNAIVKDFHCIHSGNLYTVIDIESGVKVALYEEELQSMYEHDMKQVKFYKEV